MSYGFLSTPSARRATDVSDATVKKVVFLSTPSARRATRRRALCFEIDDISIHALREEGDLGAVVKLPDEVEISIHALREEGDLDGLFGSGLDGGISIHALREEGDDPRHG